MERLGKERHGRKSPEVAVSESGYERINSSRNAAIEESAYWLELLVESGLVSEGKLAPLRQECEEVTAIFVTSEDFLILPSFVFLLLRMVNYQAARARNVK